MAGSYYVETLTDELIDRSRRIIADIDAMGGSVAAIESGWMQGRVAESAYVAQQAIESGERVVVGVNRFAESESGPPLELQRIDERVERQQVERLARFLAARDSKAVERELSRIRTAASRSENLMPFFIDAVDTGVTLGEICNVLREVFGTYRSKEVVA
jgi:methylmalonyl-CoA mutase N-terminal domain/subunit